MLAASSVQHRGARHPDENENDDAEDSWMDPNLTEPKLQDAFERCRHQRLQQKRQRPQAARGSKSAPHHANGQQPQQQQMAQIRYFKYIPYQGMSEPDRQKYLSLGTARLTSSRTEPVTRRSTATSKQQQQQQQQDSAAAAFWQSGSKAKSLKAYDYHLAELSMAYRSSPSLLGRPRRFTPPQTPQQQQQRQQQQQQEQAAQESRKSLFYQLHSSRMLPATAPSATQQQLMAPTNMGDTARAEKTTQVSRGGTPFIDSALSGEYQHPPAEPRDVVSKSASNRLLNVVSVDECHINHRRRRRRLRRVRGADVTGTTPRDATEAEEEEEEDGEEEEEEVVEWLDGDAAEDETTDLEKQEQQDQQPHLDWGQKTDSPLHHRETSSPAPASSPTAAAAAAATAAASAAAVVATAAPDTTAAIVVATRPTTNRSSKKSKRRSEQEMRRLAAAKFLRRNEILREKISIYLDWKLDRERFGREVAGCGGCATSDGGHLLAELREGDAATRFERFTAELVHQEALVANQYRSSGGPIDQLDDAADEEEGEIAAPKKHHHHSQHQQQQHHQEPPNVMAAARETGDKRAELSLTEMFDVLNV